jgi:hypothetical protein
VGTGSATSFRGGLEIEAARQVTREHVCQGRGGVANLIGREKPSGSISQIVADGPGADSRGAKLVSRLRRSRKRGDENGVAERRQHLQANRGVIFRPAVEPRHLRLFWGVEGAGPGVRQGCNRVPHIEEAFLSPIVAKVGQASLFLFEHSPEFLVLG